MKNIGKQEVLCESFLNGKSQNAGRVKLTVYEKADGTYWINRDRRKHQIEKRPDGTLYHAEYVTEIGAKSIEEVYADLRKKVEDNATAMMADLTKMGLL